MTTIAELTSNTLAAPGAVLTYDIRGADSDTTSPVLLIIGSPMGASGFVTLASHFPDRTVVTYDPRGVDRSTKDDPLSPSTPQEHADDLHRIIAELGTRPVDIFASSGGAVNALALVAAHPEQVGTLVAHEPPLASILPDREGALAVCRAVHDAYEAARLRRRHGAFHRRVSHQGPMNAEFAASPTRSRDVRDADRGRRQPHRPAARPEPAVVHGLRARLRGPAGCFDPDRAGRRCRVRR